MKTKRTIQPIRVTVTIPRDMHKELEGEASAKSRLTGQPVSISRIIREWLDYVMKNTERDK